MCKSNWACVDEQTLAVSPGRTRSGCVSALGEGWEGLPQLWVHQGTANRQITHRTPLTSTQATANQSVQSEGWGPLQPFPSSSPTASNTERDLHRSFLENKLVWNILANNCQRCTPSEAHSYSRSTLKEWVSQLFFVCLRSSWGKWLETSDVEKLKPGLHCTVLLIYY